jgi:D-glycero-alpha-D-manno-heptose 1-phosphate guanylyltransferase
MIQAVLLVGGRGTRLQEVTGGTPKPLALVGDRPFLFYVLSFLRRHGISDVVLCTGYGHEQIEGYCGDGRTWDLRIAYSRELVALGTAGAICNATPFLLTDPVLVLNGDTIVDFSVAAALRCHQQWPKDATLVVVPQPDSSDFGLVQVDQGGMIVAFTEKDTGRKGGLVSGGAYILSRELIASMSATAGAPRSLEQDVLPAWAAGGRLHAFQGNGYFLDIGTPDRYRKAIREVPEVWR